MTNYTDLSSITLAQNDIIQYIFNKEKPDNIDQHLTQIIIDLIKQRGFTDYDSQCVTLLQTCLIDFYNDLLIRFKQHFESIGSSITIQDAFQRTLNDIMSINLRELHSYMKRKH
ncbi:unnamed protein product [Rotaria sordida]|uniref:Uncharacterized protein n=1 Tax=Rotaria sordida TaxID=392033 RepID=A0A813XW90_9BILA|nr:unnamed protein product [Rotaria sordida]CAF0808245.1 unnamed protein product [Rotaria sordida]CAF0876537.1 unnamed protein product [Rotaria sordida]CAF3605454.1 unnamed protein product [Rotaria sordida]